MRLRLAKNNIDLLPIPEDQDAFKVMRIMEMMQLPAWRDYQSYVDQIRNELIEIGKEGIKKRTTNDLSDKKWAILFGYDIATSFLSALKEGVDKMIENARTPQGGDQNDGPAD